MSTRAERPTNFSTEIKIVFVYLYEVSNINNVVKTGAS